MQGRVDFPGCGICGRIEGLYHDRCCYTCWIDRAEKAEAEVQRLTALNTYGVEELKKAEAAVLRQALHQIKCKHLDKPNADKYPSVVKLCYVALSGEAGKELLERVRKLEAVAELSKVVFDEAEKCFGIENWDRLEVALASLDGESKSKKSCWICKDLPVYKHTCPECGVPKGDTDG